MRIAFVNDYSLEHIGGAPMSMLEQKHALEAAGHEVFVLHLGKKPTHPTYDTKNFIYIKPDLVFPKSLYSMTFIFAGERHDAEIKTILKEHRIEVVHTQSDLTLAFAVVKCAKELGIPAVSTVHAFNWGMSMPAYMQATQPAMRRLLEKAMRRKFSDFSATGTSITRMFKSMILTLAEQVDVVISPSRHQMESIKDLAPGVKVVNIPNPSRNEIGTEPRVVNTEPHVFTLVWAGRMETEKRPAEFLQAVKLARSMTKQPFTIEIVGTGTVLPALKRKYPLDNVTFHGHLSHEETLKVMDAADAFFMSSYHIDNQPMVIAEALSRYRPVVYCDERLTEGTDLAGYLTKDSSIESMARGIVELVEHPEKVQKLSRRAKQAALLFKPETYVEKVTEVYSRLLT